MQRRRVILVTDGDEAARRAVEVACRRLGLFCISRSAGNPTPLSGRALAELALSAADDPVVVMLDDDGEPDRDRGERALEELARDDRLEILGAVAVASDTRPVRGTPVDVSVDRRGRVAPRAVDKHGHLLDRRVVKGDTVDVLQRLRIPVVVGLGDPGKMDGRDDAGRGAPLTVKALREVLDRAGEARGGSRRESH